MPETSIPHSPLAMVEVTCPQGEPAGYEKLYTDCYQIAYSRAMYLLGQHEDAEDAVQAAFCEIWKHWATLEPRGLHSYVRTAVTRKAIDISRRKRPFISLEANEIDAAVSWDADTLIDLEAAREKLSPKLQQVVDMRMEGATWGEIQAKLGITHACLNKRFYWMRVYLRKAVAA